MATRVPLIPGTIGQLTGVVDPTLSSDAATKNYTDQTGSYTSARTRLSGGTVGTTVIINQVVGQPVTLAVTTTTDATAIVATLNALGANATSISNQNIDGNTLLVQSWAALTFQVVATFPSATTLAQVQALFNGVRSDSVYYGGPTTGEYVFQNGPKKAIADQFIAGTNITLSRDASQNVTINSTGGGGSTETIFNVGRTYIADNVGLLVRTTTQTPVQTSAAGSIVNIDDFGSITITSTPFPPVIPAGYNNYFLGISSSDNLTWGGVGRFSQTGIDQISWIRKPSAAVSFTNANLWILVATLSTVYSAVDENTAQTVTGPVSSILTPEATHVYGDDGIGNKNDTITYQPFIDGRIATKIGSAPSSTYTNSGAQTVGSGFGNAGTTCTFISTSYATAKAFLQTTAIGCTPPPSGLGNWTLPSWPVLISNIANPTSTQFATVTQIQESSSTSFLSITFTGNAPYFAGFTTQQSVFFLGNTAFVFVPNVVSGINQITVASLNSLKGPLTLTAGTGIGISTGTNAITVTNTGAGTPGSGNSIAFTNNQHGEVLITEAATESVYVQIGYTSSLEIGSGGTLGGVTYFDTTNQAATGAGLGIRTRVATTYTSLNPVFYTPAYQVNFSTPAGASATDYSLDNLLFAKKTFTGNIYANTNLWPPFRDANISDDIQLIPVKAPTFSVVSSGTNQWTATIGDGIWDASFSGYTWLTTDLLVEYVAYLRIYENSGVSRPPTGISVTRTSGLGGIRLLSSLPGTSGSTPTLAQVLAVGNQTGAGRSIIYQDSSATPNTVSIAAPSAITTSYNLKLPAAQAASSGQVLANDGTGNLSWATSSSGTQLYSTVPFKTTGGGQGFTYIEVSSLTGLSLSQVQSYFPLNSQYTINRFFGTTDLLVLTVNGAVTQSGANFR
ncbi:MAG: hypothetical protein ORN54_10250, partial [Cyclobacteriaceae bacterium]|nr:hypothetical protein [Cyclobacteriaceae bacterium]